MTLINACPSARGARPWTVVAAAALWLTTGVPMLLLGILLTIVGIDEIGRSDTEDFSVVLIFFGVCFGGLGPVLIGLVFPLWRGREWGRVAIVIPGSLATIPYAVAVVFLTAGLASPLVAAPIAAIVAQYLAPSNRWFDQQRRR